MNGIFSRVALAGGLSLAAASWSAQAQAGAAASYRVLHSFCVNANCADGKDLVGDQLIRDAGGDLFGTAKFGGRFGNGTLYELQPKHGGAKYRRTVLKAFCDPATPCAAGEKPDAGVVIDTAGNLYGTTTQGGLGCGAVYEAVTSGAKTELKALHTFANDGSEGCVGANGGSLDYQGKETGARYDSVSPLYGMTTGGGANDAGTIYELIPPAPGHGRWTVKVLYSLSDGGGNTGIGNLAMDASGDLFGAGYGVIFELTPNGSGGFNYNLLYTSNSGEAYGSLTLAADGTLIGTSLFGGPNNNSGSLFKLAPVAGGGYQYTLLYGFCLAVNCTDGRNPAGAVMIDAGGNIFGTTEGGGMNNGHGVIFEYTSGGTYTVLHDFCALANCTDGATGIGGLITDGNGHFYGMTANGGAGVGGVVFELSLPN
jgi:uncharacterized repeat protein (TIGR03803 family)